MLLLHCKTATSIFILSLFVHLSSGTTYADDYDLSRSEYSGELSDTDLLETPEEPVYDDENEYVGSDEDADIYVYRKPLVAGSKTVKSNKNAKLGSQKVKNPRADVDAKTYDNSGEGNIYRRADNPPETVRSRTVLSDKNAKRRPQKLKNPRVDADTEPDAEKFEDELADNNDADYDEVYVPPSRREAFTDRTLRRSDVTDQPPIDPRSMPPSRREAFTDRTLRRSDVTDQPPIDPRFLPQSRREAFTDRTLRRLDVTDQPPIDPRFLPQSRREAFTDRTLRRSDVTDLPPIDPRFLPQSRREAFTDRTLRRSDVTDQPPIDPRSQPPSRRADGRVTPGQIPDQKPAIDPSSQPAPGRADGRVTPGPDQKLPIDPGLLPPSRRADGRVMPGEFPAYNPSSLRPSRRIVIPEDNANKTVPRPPMRRRIS